MMKSFPVVKKILLCLCVATVAYLAYEVSTILNQKKTNISQTSQDIQSNQTEIGEEMAKKLRIRGRSLQEFEMTKDPKRGYVPSQRLLAAAKYRDQLIASNKNNKSAIAHVSWTNKGPTNVGGRTRAILFDPNDPTAKKVFAGGVSGGLWTTKDITSSTSSWTKINDFMDNLAITSIIADPQNANTFYAATGEAYSSVTQGLGIFKSIDGGATWTSLPNTVNYKYIAEILIRVEGGISVLYMASHRNFVGSSVGSPGNLFPGEAGLFRSANGGTSWTQVIPDNDDNRTPDVDDIAIDASGNLWSSTGSNAFGDKGGDIFTCSAGCDMSTNWIKKYDASANGVTDINRMVIALAPSNANVVYGVAGKDGAGKTDVAAFIKSTNGGNSWTKLPIIHDHEISDCTQNTNHFTNGQATYDLCMTVHPTNENLVLIGGINMYRTSNGFTTHRRISAWYQGPAPCDKEMHADQHLILFRPGFPNEVIFGNDGGVYYSSDAGNGAVGLPTFSHHVKDYNVSQCYAVDISPIANAEEFLAGLQDNGTQDWDATSGSATSEAVGGDGGYCHIDQNEPGTQIGSYVYNDFTITTDEWANKTQINPTPQTGRFINPSDYADTNNILYSGSSPDTLCMLVGVGSTNTLMDGIPVGGDKLGGKKATTIRVDRNNNNTIYVGTDAGKIYKILNANTGTLTSVEISFGLSLGWVSSIDVEVGNSNHMLATFSNYGVVSVWESTNGGSFWLNVEGNLPDMPIRWGIFSPLNSDHAILATDLGVWSTDNLNGTNTDWGVTNTGLANVRTDMIKYRVSDKTLIIGTYGRGIYTGVIDVNSNCPPDYASINQLVGVEAGTAHYETDGVIESIQTIHSGANIQYDSKECVNLKPEFEVVQGAVFEAYIDGCPPALKEEDQTNKK